MSSTVLILSAAVLLVAQAKGAKLKQGTGHKGFKIPAGLLQTKSTATNAGNILVSSQVSSSLLIGSCGVFCSNIHIDCQDSSV